MFSDSDSETSDMHTLAINEHLEKALEYKKEREELAILKEKYGSDYSESGPSDDDSEDSEDTEEDSDGEELTPAVDAAILRTLARIRKKDPVIYESERRVFEEEHTQTQVKAPVVVKPKIREKSKPLTIREAALASVLADADAHSRSPSPHPLTHTEEQALLRSETRAAFHGALNSDAQGDDDDLLVPRSRTRDEIELEEEEYRAFLEREVGEDLHNFVSVDTIEAVGTLEDVKVVGDDDDKSERKKKKKGKKEREKEKEADQKNDGAHGKKAPERRDKKSKEEADQVFLMNYIFNRGWIDRSNRRVPTYNEIIEPLSNHKQKPGTSQAKSDVDMSQNDDEREAQEATLSDEESFDDLTDAFETSYNFRFEEPGGALVATFPRNLSSARREPTTRKDARARKKDRQEAEKQALLETRREEIRKERAMAEATFAEEDNVNEKDRKRSKKQQRKEELARLKALKASELRRKLEMVSIEGGLSGIDDAALAHLNLDADWDPSRHDAQMGELYGSDTGDDDGAEKPVWDNDINVDDIEPPTNVASKAEQKKQRKKEKRKKEIEGKDVGVNMDEMDADLDMSAGWNDDDEERRGTEEERKRKVNAYMDEVVNRLGFSGIASHMPTRFHYTSVAPGNYGLAPAEILLATDVELNSYVGLKKLAPYRIGNGGRGKKSWEPGRAQRLKEFRESLHSRMGSHYKGPWSLGAADNAKSGANEVQGEKKKRKGRKERAKLKAMQDEKDEEWNRGESLDDQLEVASESRKRKPNPGVHSPAQTPLPVEAERDMEDGTPKKKRRRRDKKGSGGAGERDAEAVS